jgi:hypothetical protein
MLILCGSAHGQNGDAGAAGVDVAARKIELLADLKALSAEAMKLDKPLARAAAEAEIAASAWSLDREWAKVLLLEAFRRTFPPEAERRPSRPVGAPPRLRGGVGRVRDEVRARIFSIAARDQSFARQLAQEGAGHVDLQEENTLYAELARRSLDAGNREDAINYSLRTFEIDPTQLSVSGVINDLALQDRAAADRLILRYIESLRPLPLSLKNGSLLRVQWTLYELVLPGSIVFESSRRVPPPGPEVMRAFAAYVVEALTRMAQAEPDGLKFGRTLLLSAWLPLKQHAPELTPAFMELERLTRAPGQPADLPTQTYEERSREYHEKQDREALKSDRPDERAIGSLITRGEFDTARKLIGKLPDGEQKDQLTERANASEALSLAEKGDIAGATRLAERLTKAISIGRVYPAVVGKCAARKDQSCVTSLVYQALKQLKSADHAPPAAPAGLPAAALPTEAEIDHLLLGLGRFVKAVAPLNPALAGEVLDELVQAANRSRVDTEQGRTGFEPGVFEALARRDEPRARQSADGLKDRLRRIVALADIYKWRAAELTEMPARVSKDKQEE